MSTYWYLPGLLRRCALPYNEGNPETVMPPVEIYTTRWCPYCHAAKRLLQRKGVAFSEIDVGRDWERREEMVERANGRSTVPQIFIGDTHVGGCDELHDLEDASKLDALLAQKEQSA
jgi:glutaredoxin 3